MTEPTPDPLDALLASGEVSLDPAARQARRGDRLIQLTDKEYEVLRDLLAKPGSSSTLDRIWDEDRDPFTTTVRVTMMTLRRKLAGPGPDDGLAGVREPRRPRPRHDADAAPLPTEPSE